MSQFQPLPGVAYRIQSVKSGKYLEFDNGAVVASRRDNVLAQQWTFTRTVKDTYVIVNVALNADRSRSALSVDSVGLVGKEDEEEATTNWRVYISSDKNHCWITTRDVQGPRSHDYLETVNDKLVKTAADSKQDNQKWRIILGLPSAMSRTTYRLRSADTTTALTLRKGSVTMLPPETGPDQAWEAIQMDGGDYEIKKVGQGEYLSWSRVEDGVYKTVTSSQPARWEILQYMQSNYGIFPKIPGENFALTGRADVPLDAPSQGHSGQRWLLEPYTPDTSPTITQPSQTIIPPRRVSGVPEGIYMIGSVGTGYNVHVGSADYDTPAVAIASPSPVGFGFLYQSPTSPFFLINYDRKLSMVPGPAGTPIRLAGARAEAVRNLWYLIEEPGTSEYYICSDVAGKRLAWGKSVKSQLSTYYEVFTTEEWVKGDPNQRWVLTPKS